MRFLIKYSISLKEKGGYELIIEIELFKDKLDNTLDYLISLISKVIKDINFIYFYIIPLII
jgi:hypothetical protein